MTARELAAAGVHDPVLRAAYERCRRVNARGGATYFLATRLLTPCRRPAVHALYGFARHADDIVDDVEGVPGQADTAARTRALDALDATVRQALATGRSDHPLLAALADTAARYRIEPAHFTDFMHSMRMDLHITDYPSWQALRTYTHGSAAVIGLQLLPVLGTVAPREEAAPHAASLGVAFQLTNFLRDVGEDLDRGRIYLPGDLLAAHGVYRELLVWCRATGTTEPRVRAALREAIAVTRGIYRHAAEGIDLLHPASRPCVRTAFVLYHAILNRIEAADYAVMDRRAVVPRRYRAAVALGGLAAIAAGRARVAVRGDGTGPPRTKAYRC
ncbi:phytoene/squalene synthase family protein [Streptomyces sp. JJ66]|uniref:phytoene/squalene synthase family protein n=1 Tax=Streptomyces sp. JJ66 TaxID=2803843 RepID=UPI001C565BE2|nr:phytoene/squalene synthase family protein [Streptomyces sp. JJ66]MBW1602035.1 phytoene/squalene synthase family protein [Streptomyces sp. JJ66]